ncbi:MULTISPECIES: DMT family transporter [Gammaproteobacteria]|jgi:drug/metabolite transporter (DMT)-like permease|uniref:EamA family transporter n=1 Tax=Vreelandella halophila TaxID=86177 RepID=A0A9X4YDN8_9GAMM|nr:MULTISPECIES: DMT family transporter [Gammaproteobacteria]KAA8985456.1 DMT family transporter [Halospina sp. K52047b]MYL27784.1 EamA family transporter [Halomonas utahensis]MYL74910.1 EamA family transporter [Halomonas sp. 22501_18_FS]
MAGATALVMLASLCWGLSGGIGGILMADGWDAFVVSFYRGAIGLVFVLGWLAIRPGNSGLANRKLWFWSAIAGLGVAGNFSFYFLSISEGSVAVAATLMYCAPVFVYLLSFALKLESPTPLKWAAIVMVMVGIVLLTRIYDVNAGGVTALGVGAGLLAGLSYAIFIFGFKYAAPHGTPQAILTIAFTALVIILGAFGDSSEIAIALSTPDWPLFVTLGILGAGLSFIFYIIGLNHTAPAVASIVAMVEPVTASLFGVVVLEETLVALQIVGMALILATVTALSVFSGPPAAALPEPEGGEDGEQAD